MLKCMFPTHIQKTFADTRHTGKSGGNKRNSPIFPKTFLNKDRGKTFISKY